MSQGFLPTTLRATAVPTAPGPTAPVSTAPRSMVMGATAAATSMRARWGWPLDPRPEVLRRFELPTSRWGAGHRGVDLSSTVGESVYVVADGVVTHVGVIAGRGTISVLHQDGVRSTYEPVDPVQEIVQGALVTRGQPLGAVSEVAGHCAPSTCLHLGAKRDDAYLDPLTYLQRPRIILLPVVPTS